MTDFKKKSVKDLEKLIIDKREELREFRFKSAGSRTRNVREGRNVRREVAQILTELNARTKVAK
ncbi:50S ribosomal protein L29 [Candidatus Kaiserbacteria bacterium]|nr:MAG: 50S ribosomal protein L29 [Candidatus Kaiserbacteria bacterium]PCI89561.1 MAG: 50S ribosomal protein L29 [Candidatus Kaiserbacteria bacterium]PCI89893.1 MAG: 50S ribosomal protein L29 [Candidatus Kaiserbacteria bacterium]